MTATEFIKKWQGVQLKEKSSYQEHFLDLCRLIDHPSPVETDKEGVSFCFEKGAIKTGGGNGWADVWKRGHFAMEYKGPGGDLQKALQQVQRYALALENPPLLVVSDVATIIITTNFTNTVSETHTIALDDIGTPENLRKLHWMFFEPAQFRPGTKVLDRIVAGAGIFEAWGDEPWVNEGAAVRVSLIAFGQHESAWLDGNPVSAINADLTAGHADGALDLTKARRLHENSGVAYQGPVLVGPFDIDGKTARMWLTQPNPHGKPNADVLRPLINGRDITSRSRGLWVIDFAAMSETNASYYELPFQHVQQHVKPLRDSNRDQSRKERWWLHGRLGNEWRSSIVDLPRYIATTRVAKHRTFVWLPVTSWPSDAVVGIARSDDASFGILHSRFHELWSLGLCTWLGVGNDPRYTPTTTFETFPFPHGLTPNLSPDSYDNPHAAAIADAAHKLNDLRERWLTPPEWTDHIPEVVPGYPDRIVPKLGHEQHLKKRTLTNLYNERPQWLQNAHQDLDMAVAHAYGWTDYTPDLPDDEILKRLLALNLERSQSEATGSTMRNQEGSGVGKSKKIAQSAL